MNREDDDEGSNDVHSRLLSTLLNEMDGVNSNKATTDLLIVGTTNRITAIDAALLRPGRFEEHARKKDSMAKEIMVDLHMH